MDRYSSALMDHFNSPRNGGVMQSPDGVGHADRGGQAPRMTIYVKVKEGKVTQANFTAFGCGVTIAVGSAITELAMGRPIEECLQIAQKDVVAALDGIPEGKRFCADIALAALHNALRDSRSLPRSAAAPEQTESERI